MADPLNNITLEKNKNQIGKIKVHSEIIDTLSSGIYSTPATCIKELINNSFDADAKKVTIRIKPVHDTITIIDDGQGMNAIDFDENFAWISKSNKRNSSESSPNGRPLIGKIGIGFIAVNEICDELEVISTKKGQTVKFTARINFKNFLEKDVLIDGGIIKGEFNLINEDEAASEHYTIINLIGLKESVKNILNDRQFYSTIVKEGNKDFDRSQFKNMKELVEHHYDKKLKSIEKDNAYIQFVMDLAAYIPVEYIEKGPIEGVEDPVIKKIVEMHRKFDFKVDLDGIYLKKPIFFPKKNPARKYDKYVIKSFKHIIEVPDGRPISFSGYFYAWNELLVPHEFNGVAIRIRNIPIAPRFGFDTTFLGYPNYTDQLFRNWLMGEIYIQEGLEDAMNIDRKSFRQTHPEYLLIQNWIHEFLRNEIFAKLVQGVYAEGRKEREKKKASEKNKIQKKMLETKKITLEISPPPKKGVEKAKDVVSKDVPLNISQKNKSEVVITIDSSIKKKYLSDDWNVLEDVFIIFELAFKEAKGDANKLRELFYSKMAELNELKRERK